MSFKKQKELKIILNYIDTIHIYLLGHFYLILYLFLFFKSV